MREIRLYGSEGGGAARSPYPYLAVKEKGEMNEEDSRRSKGIGFAAVSGVDCFWWLGDDSVALQHFVLAM